MVEVSDRRRPAELDNRRWLVVPVRESLNVLLVDGHFKSEPYQAETDYLAQALCPAEESPGQPRPIKVEVVSESQLSRRELAPYDVVVLCNVAQFSQAEVDGPRGLSQARGRRGRLRRRSGRRRQLQPAALRRRQGAAAGRDRPERGRRGQEAGGLQLQPAGLPAPDRRGVSGRGRPGDRRADAGADLAVPQADRCPKGSKAEVALAFENGDPAVVEAPRHRGTVILVATSADTGWTTWPIHKSYPPVMQQIVLQAVGRPALASGTSGSASRSTSRSRRRRRPRRSRSSRPRGRPVATKLQPAGGVSQFHFEQTDLSGAYQVKVGPPLALESSFAANPDPAESDLAKLDRAGLAELLPGWKFIYVI